MCNLDVRDEEDIAELPEPKASEPEEAKALAAAEQFIREKLIEFVA